MSVEETWVGRHYVRFEPGDLLVMEFHGPILPGEMAALARLTDERLLARGRLFVLCDISDAGGFSHGSRHELRDRPRKLPPHFVAYVGAPAPVRVVLDLVIRATSSLTGAKIAHRFFETQAKARAWLGEMHTKAA
ncbi:STAS/SEC14 domain-containing protein [Polyangium fumosum]|uniref:STAS/SEC14 domain-containing protein n=1 Tax=Polyangium fumosum TaxID=889272 RepID=A0A4U1JHY7_9BACT|nr:STAS/SEC14 domain-containing protein [Polyangium fumosum]TKD10119.1 STAS/SEC14 domain-containing protein [Polyangium fumosum]